MQSVTRALRRSPVLGSVANMHSAVMGGAMCDAVQNTYEVLK